MLLAQKNSVNIYTNAHPYLWTILGHAYLQIYMGNKTEWSQVWSVITWEMNKIAYTKLQA